MKKIGEMEGLIGMFLCMYMQHHGMENCHGNIYTYIMIGMTG